MLRVAKAAALALTLTIAGSAEAGAVLTSTSASLARLDVQAAVAATPYGSTRWSRITIEGATRVSWLVPVRPGGSVDWASDAWLEALDEATSPRIYPPVAGYTGGESLPSWDRRGPKRAPTAMTVASSDGALRLHLEQRGFALPGELGARIDALFAQGWSIVVFEFDVPGGAVVSSPTVRVSDDGAATLPFALIGARSETRSTVFTITSGAATTPAARELDPSSVTWDGSSSNYPALRASGFSTSAWLRESSSHDVLFVGEVTPRASRTAPLARTYFERANIGSSAACDETARLAGASTSLVGRVCATGSVARVPGGNACVASSGALDAAAFACGSGVDDLALALAGGSPAVSFVTRFAGLVPAGALGADAPLVTNASSRSPVIAIRAASRPPPATSNPDPLVQPPPDSVFPTDPVVDDAPVVFVTDGCSGGAAVVDEAVVEEEAALEDSSSDTCSGSPGYSDDGTTSDEGATDEESTDEEDSEEYDDEDDASYWDDDEDDSSDWGDDDTESASDDSSSDGCSSSPGESSSSGGDWGSEESGATSSSALSVKAAKHAHAKRHVAKTPGAKKHGAKKHPKQVKTTKRRSSPVSRVALLFGAIILPFRRRFRVAVPGIEPRRP